MADKYNMVSGTVDPELPGQMLATINHWKERLPFLVALDKQTRTRLVWPGTNGLEASGAMADAAEAYPGLSPGAVADPAELRRDVALAKALAPVRDALASLTQAIDNTIAAAGSDAYRTALKLYAIAHVVKDQAPGIEERIRPLAAHLDRPSRRP